MTSGSVGATKLHNLFTALIGAAVAEASQDAEYQQGRQQRQRHERNRSPNPRGLVLDARAHLDVGGEWVSGRQAPDGTAAVDVEGVGEHGVGQDDFELEGHGVGQRTTSDRFKFSQGEPERVADQPGDCTITESRLSVIVQSPGWSATRSGSP